MGAELRNYTPFAALSFESRGHGGEEYHVIVVKATLELKGGSSLPLSRVQDSLRMSDEYHGDPTHSSVKYETDINPYKPSCDILVLGHARAPSGVAAQSWPLTVQVGEVVKQLRVTSPRAWQRGADGTWSLATRELVAEVPLRYELAFGGVSKDGRVVAAENPVGLGLTYPGDDRDEVAAPQLEDPGDPVHEFGASHVPQGLGPIARMWQPRLARAGTFDSRWLAERWPDIPDDFDHAHYNSAHPDLIAPGFLQGDEPLLLEGLLAGGTLRSKLPGYALYVVCRLLRGAIVPAPMSLDTLVIDVDTLKVYLVWRLRLPKHIGVRVFEARFSRPRSPHVEH